MPHLCNSVMSFSKVLHIVLIKLFWCITPPDIEQMSVSLVCMKFKTSILGYIRQCVSLLVFNLRSSYCEIELV